MHLLEKMYTMEGILSLYMVWLLHIPAMTQKVFLQLKSVCRWTLHQLYVASIGQNSRNMLLWPTDFVDRKKREARPKTGSMLFYKKKKTTIVFMSSANKTYL